MRRAQLNRNWNVRRGHCPHNKMVENPGKISVAESEIQIKAIRAQGAGGQNVNKVSSAIHLRFDIAASSLDDIYKERLLNSTIRGSPGKALSSLTPNSTAIRRKIAKTR